MEIAIIVVCAIFAFVCQPFVDRIIRKKVPSRWPATILRLVIYWIIFMALYAIAACMGFDISK